MEKFKLGLIGTFIRDRIFPLNGTEVESLGGLYHTLANAAFLGGELFKIVPVARVGHDFYPHLRQVLQPLPGVDLSQLILDSRENTQVKLIYQTPTSRQEVTTSPMAPLHNSEVHELKRAHAIIVNMITGEDIALNALSWLSENSSAIIYFDFHTLASGIDEQGKRFYRKLNNWQQWFMQVDIVQMNQEEAATLWEIEAKNEHAAYAPVIDDILAMNPFGVHITLGEKGVLSGFRDAKNNLIRIRHNRFMHPENQVRDIIGCGDAFGSAFMIHYLITHDFFAAAQFATKIATLNTTFMGSLTRDKFERNIKPYANITT